jgi:hypothetical protein
VTVRDLGASPLRAFTARLPAIANAIVVDDGAKLCIVEAELVADPLDYRSDIASIPVFPVPGYEAGIMDAIVDSSIGNAVPCMG